MESTPDGLPVHTDNADDIHSFFEDLSDKKGVMKAVLEHEKKLLYIPLSFPVVSIRQAQKDFQRERVLLNDVPFVPDSVDTYRNTSFVSCLRLLTERMEHSHPNCYRRDQSKNVKTEDIDHACDIILQRASRTGCGSDSFFMVQSLFCLDSTFVTQRADPTDRPIRLDVFLSPMTTLPGHTPQSSYSSDATTPQPGTTPTGTTPPNPPSPSQAPTSAAMCVRIQVYNNFNIIDQSSMERVTEDRGPHVWLRVASTVIDESNLYTGYHRRYLQLRVTVPFGRSKCGSCKLTSDVITHVLKEESNSSNEEQVMMGSPGRGGIHTPDSPSMQEDCDLITTPKSGQKINNKGFSTASKEKRFSGSWYVPFPMYTPKKPPATSSRDSNGSEGDELVTLEEDHRPSDVLPSNIDNGIS